MKILKSTDRVKVKIGEVSLLIAPLKQSQKIELVAFTKVSSGQEIADIGAQVSYIVKHAIKGVEGVTDHEDKPIALQFEADGSLTDDSHSDVMFIVNQAKGHYEALFKVAGNQLPGEIVDTTTGKKLKGVEVTVNPKT